jgi:hypothetical protein
MSPFLDAVDELVKRATTHGTLRDLQQATGRVHQAIASASAGERDEALRRLSAGLPKMHPVPASKVAVTCGAIVENGGDPHISGPALLPRLPPTLEGAVRFHELCARKAAAEGLTGESEEEEENGPPPEKLAEKYFAAIHAEEPGAAFAYMGEQDVSLAVIAHLARSKQLRAAARAAPDLLDKSLAHDRVFRGGHSFLTKMLLVLDDEPLLVLDTDQNKGYRGTISAIPDNFTLHTQLMGRLFGDPAEGWIEAVGFDKEAIAYAMTHVGGKDAPTVTGAFNLWNWTGLQADGTLPKPMAATEHWIWNEGVPADILPFEGARVVLLGPPAYSRSWRGGLIFDGLLPEFVVNEKLPESAVREWFRKLAAAPRPALAKES